MTNKLVTELSSYGLHLLKMNEHSAQILSEYFVEQSPWKNLSYRAQTLFDYLVKNDCGYFSYILVENNREIGFFTIRTGWLKGVLIESIGILEDYRGRGAGSIVLKSIEQILVNERNNNLWVVVSDFNDKAIGFYVKNGFQKVGDIDNFIKEGKKEVLYRKVVKFDRS